MTRVRSTDLWYNAPGIVAAYQPVAAPDPFAARQNVSNDARQASVYAAANGVAPAWSSRTGWTGNGTTQYLTTGITPSSGWSMVVRVDGVTLSNARCAAGSSAVGDTRFMIHPTHSGFGGGVLYGQGFYTSVTPGVSAGVLAISGQRGYRNGVAETGTIGSWSGTGNPIFLLARNSGSPGEYLPGSLVAALIVRRSLSATEVWQYSRQMAYCNVNPDWSAWGRRRRYYYAPSEAAAAAGTVGIYGRRGSVALPGGVRIEAVR